MRPVPIVAVPLFACVAQLFFLFVPVSVPAIECYECHGTKISDTTGDYRPVDSPYRNISSGGFQGNHRTHMDQPASPASCAKCHPGSAEYGPGHRNAQIDISPNINTSPLAAIYRNGSTSFPQRPVPRLGQCSNVNCHFERETPVWGGAVFSVPNGCSQCHGAPPDGGDKGAAGSHGRHDLYYAGPGGCAQCHTDHRTDGSPFAHATSAGRLLILAVQNPFSSPRGSYSGPLDDYLPKSQSNQFGNCSNVYCHSKGDSKTGFLPNIEPTWGTPLPADCTGCHGNGHGTAAEITSGSHTMHVGRDYYGQYVFACSICHSSTASGNTTVDNRQNHVNRRIDVVPNASFGGTYTANGHAPGGAFGQCANNYCHSDVQPDGGVGGPTTYDNPTWGAKDSVFCGDCHATGGHGHGTTSRMATGSHVKHLSYAFTTTTDTVKCMICHKYTDYPFVTSCFGNPYGNIICHASGTSAKHANGKIDVRLDPVFGNMSAYQGSPEPGNGYSNCTNTYCHSNGSSIATGSIPPGITTNWGSGSLACNACHGNPPAYVNGTPKANSHPSHIGASCDRCHFGTTTSGTAISSTTLHVNKAYDVTAGNGVTFGYTYAGSGGACSTISCHGGRSATWGTTLPCNECHDAPPDTASHRKHFSGTVDQAGYGDVRIAQDFTANASGYIMNCGNCHPMDMARHGNGVVDVELFNPLAPAGSLKSSTPASASYTNGTTIHTDSRGFAYTNGTCSNVYCHSYNDWTTPGGVAAYTNFSTYWPPNLVITRHFRTVSWNGPPLTCSGCHANPPRTRYPDNDLGSGDSHSWINAGDPSDPDYANGVEERHNINMGYNPMPCRTCHYETVRVANTWTIYSSNSQYMKNPSDVPINNFSRHVNGKGSVDFDRVNPTVYETYWYGTRTRTLESAQYNSERMTCSNVSCHQDQTLIKWGQPYKNDWSNDQCNVCHGY